MGGFFGVVSQQDCVRDLYYGTDYHSHLGTQRGGLAVWNGHYIDRIIHDIRNAQFRSKFDADLHKLQGPAGIGVISDNEDQPVFVSSHLGLFAIVTVARINNLPVLAREAYGRGAHFVEISGGLINPTELIATLINQGRTFEEGFQRVQELVDGSCSILLLTEGAVYAMRDRWGRTPVILGRKDGTTAVTFETCAFPNLDFVYERDLGPGEVVRITADGAETVVPPRKEMKICAFLWVYFGYPASSYEGRNVEVVRNRQGAALARRDPADVDLVAGIPDSGVGCALGYAAAAGIPYRRPFVKYTPTWPRSFMPQHQEVRDLVARMKLIPVPGIINGQRMLFCDDSIVRGTQLREPIKRLFEAGARAVHMRPACPPLMFGCKFLNFSRSKSELDLAARRTIREMEGGHDGEPPAEYLDPESPKYLKMCDRIGHSLGLTSLRYQRLDDLAESIGLPCDRLCTYCWNKQG